MQLNVSAARARKNSSIQLHSRWVAAADTTKEQGVKACVSQKLIRQMHESG